MFKQILSVVAAALLVKDGAARDKPTNPNEYMPDPVMKYGSVECYMQKPIPPKPEGTVRMAVVGDMTTVGYGSDR